MKNFFFYFLGVCLSLLCIHFVSAWPSPEELTGAVETESQLPAETEEIKVEPRVTCDLMYGSAWGDRLCAAHCIAKGYRGGWCDSKRVCNCRK